MKFVITLKRKQTLNQAENARKKRVECYAQTKQTAESYALTLEDNWRYFVIDSTRAA